MTQTSLVLLVRTATSLVLQLLLLGIGARTAWDLYRNRHLGRRPLRSLLSNKPLVVISVVSAAHSVLTAIWLTRWVRRVNAATPD